MAENIPESEAAKAALAGQNAPPGMEQVTDAPNGGNGDNLDELSEVEEIEESGGETMDYAGAVRDTYLLDIFLYREDNSKDFQISYKEVSEVVFKRLGVPQGMLRSVDTTPYKKFTIELDNMVQLGNLNITQSLQVRSGLYTRPLQAPEKDREVLINWAPMKIPGKDIESVLKWFGTITVPVENVVLRDTGHDDWTSYMDGVITTERRCKMKISTNIPSLIMVRGIKMRCSYPGQPKTCSRCMRYWSSCPGGGKVEKCKKEAPNDEKDLKTFFKNFMNRLKRKEKGLPEVEATSGPVIPEHIPDPDAVRFTGFPEDVSLEEFKEWLDEKGICFLDPMVFKETKPGAFSIATVKFQDGEMHKLEAQEAADLVTKLNGITFDKTNKRIMVTMMKLTTPEKEKNNPEVVQLDDSDGEISPPNEQLALTNEQGGASEASTETKTPEKSGEEAEGGDDEDEGAGKSKDSLKINISAEYTKGGTRHHRVVGGKAKRTDLLDTSSIEASPELVKTQTQTRTGRGKNGGKNSGRTKPESEPTKAEKNNKSKPDAKKKKEK